MNAQRLRPKTPIDAFDEVTVITPGDSSSCSSSRQSDCSTSDNFNINPQITTASDAYSMCGLCKSPENNPSLYGEKICYFNDKIKQAEYVHIACLLFASGLKQGGDPEEEVFGFLLKDIAKEKARGNQLRCSYCDVRGATVGCFKSDCQVKYHLACAMAQPSSIRPSISYVDPYKSFCGAHRPPRKLHSLNLLNERGVSRCTCPICQERVKILPHILYEVIQCPHCAQLIHIDCLRGWAYSAGRAHFKCPACNCRKAETFDTEPMSENDPELPRISIPPTCGYSDVISKSTGQPLLYSHALLVREEKIDRAKLSPLQCQRLLIGHCLDNGVNVPAKDADWELDQARRELYNEARYHCTAPKCLCPRGTKYDDPIDSEDEDNETSFSPWNMILCVSCEGIGMHRKCFQESFGKNIVFICEVCKNLSPTQ